MNWPYAACSGQEQPTGCLPVIFPVLLFVLHFNFLRALTNFRITVSRYSGICICRWRDRVTASRFLRSSSKVFSFLWWTIFPAGSGPFSASQIITARNFQTFGSATFTQARRTPPRLCRVLMVTVPTGRWLCAFAMRIV